MLTFDLELFARPEDRDRVAAWQAAPVRVPFSAFRKKIQIIEMIKRYDPAQHIVDMDRRGDGGGTGSGRDTGPDRGRETGPDSGGETGSSSGRGTGSDSGRGTGPDHGRETGPDSGRETGTAGD